MLCNEECCYLQKVQKIALSLKSGTIACQFSYSVTLRGVPYFSTTDCFLSDLFRKLIVLVNASGLLMFFEVCKNVTAGN